MARDMHKIRTVSASAALPTQVETDFEGSSTASSFDPENEALVSTRHLDNHAQPLPELRESAKKYRYPRAMEPELQIDTSAIHRAFPDFSQGLSSLSQSMSIEMGRGAPTNGLNRASEFSPVEFGASFNSADSQSRHLMTGKSRPHSILTQNHNNGPADTRRSENVTEISQTTQQQPGGFTSARDLIQRLSNDKPNTTHLQRAARRSPTPTNTGEMNNSIYGNDMPNISELVSGIFQDGTPVFSATSTHNRKRSYNRRPSAKPKSSHARLVSIPTPDEEQAIYISLKLLQEKVATLEANKVEDAAAIMTLRAENDALAREKADRAKRADSALGSTSGSDAGDEKPSHGGDKVTAEKVRLESRISKMQMELKEMNNRYKIASATIKQITQERDAIMGQLGVAYLTTEQLKAQIKTLESENTQLKARSSAEVAIEPRSADVGETIGAGFSAGPTTEATTSQDRDGEDRDFIEILDFDVNTANGNAVPLVARERSERLSTPSVMRKDDVPSHKSWTRNQRHSQNMGPNIRDHRNGYASTEMADQARLQSDLQSNPLHEKRMSSTKDHSKRAGTHKPSGHPVFFTQGADRHVDFQEMPSGAEEANARPASVSHTTSRANLPDDITILSGANGEGVSLSGRNPRKINANSRQIELFPELRAMIEEARRTQKQMKLQRRTSENLTQHPSEGNAPVPREKFVPMERCLSATSVTNRQNMPFRAQVTDEKNDTVS